jgi:hypothetical protein
MGYAYKNTCYPDTATALVAFQSSFPQLNGTSIVSLTSSSISATGLVTFAGGSTVLTTGTNTAIPLQSIQLPACSTEFLDGSPIQDIAFVLVLVICWALGFQAGMHR